jgi:hypothetical protein
MIDNAQREADVLAEEWNNATPEDRVWIAKLFNLDPNKIHLDKQSQPKTK